MTDNIEAAECEINRLVGPCGQRVCNHHAHGGGM